MASDIGASKEILDERLAEARNNILADGEEIVAQEMGDQGQAVVLTKSRVLVLKAGLTATGTLNGQKTSAYLLSEISAVNVRKGPMGAVIQICAPNIQPSPDRPPENVVIFSGDQRVKRCESIAAKIKTALGKSADVVEIASEPDAEPVKAAPKGGREPVSLAEEMFAEMKQAQAEDIVQPAVPAQKEFVPEPVFEVKAEEPEQDLEEQMGFNPNPNLPKPMRRAHNGTNKPLMLIGALMLLVLICMAVTAPMREESKPSSVSVDTSGLTLDIKALRKQHSDIAEYASKVKFLLSRSSSAANMLKGALNAHSEAAITNALKNDTQDDMWQKLSEIEPPTGLAGAQQNITTGMFIRKAAFEKLSGMLPPFESASVQDAMAKLTEANQSVNAGIKGIDKMLNDLDKQILSLETSKRQDK